MRCQWVTVKSAKGVIKMAIENFTEVQEYLTANNIEGNEVKTYLDSLKVAPTLEVFKGLTNTDPAYKSFMDSENDKHYTKAKATWDTNNLDRIYTERFLKENPTADPKDIQLKEMKNMIEQMKNDGTRKDLINKALKVAQEKEINPSILDYFVIDETNTVKGLELLETIIKAGVAKGVEEKLKGKTPTGGTGGAPGNNPWDSTTFNLTLQGKMMMENPELAKTMMASRK